MTSAPAPVHSHNPVMLPEVMAALNPLDGGVYVDGTFGRGGYTRGILQAARCSVFAIDRDAAAIATGQALVQEFSPRLTLLHGRFSDMPTLLAKSNVTTVDGIALDLGVSSPQLDDADRGFSFRQDGPLDMRMGCSTQTAADIVNETGEADLANIIYQYGEERHSRRIAKAIVEARRQKNLTRTGELAHIVRTVLPRSRDGIDPATRTFQAIRIAVNDEVGELQRALAAAEILLRPAGRLVVVSFHSLEDRCVKEFMRTRAEAPAISRYIPSFAAPYQPSFTLLSRKPQLPGESELSANPRARSARLRVAERTTAPPMKEASS